MRLPRRARVGGTQVILGLLAIGWWVAPTTTTAQSPQCDVRLPTECAEVEHRVSLEIPPWSVPTTNTYNFGEPVYFTRAHSFRFIPRDIHDGIENPTVEVDAVGKFECLDRAYRHTDIASGTVIFYACTPARPIELAWPGGTEPKTKFDDVRLVSTPTHGLPPKTERKGVRLSFSGVRREYRKAGIGIEIERLPLGAQTGPTVHDSWAATYCRLIRLEQQRVCELDARDREISELRDGLDARGSEINELRDRLQKLENPPPPRQNDEGRRQ